MDRRTLLLVIAAGAMGCSAATTDPSLWQNSHDLGGKSLAPAAGGTGAGGGSAGQSPGFGGDGFGGTGGSGFGGTGGSGAGGTGTGGSGAGGTGTGGTGAGGTGAGGSGGSPTNSGACTFTFDYTTIPGGGTYSPRNIEAAWIMAPNGFVKSLEVHAGTRIVHLINWNKASGKNKVDAVTSATLGSHGPHHATWDCTDLNHQPVTDGAYRIYFEFTESDSAFIIYPQPKLGYVDFQKGQPADISPPDQPFFKSMHLVIK